MYEVKILRTMKVYTKGGQVYCQFNIAVGTFEHAVTTCMQLKNEEITEKRNTLSSAKSS